QDQPAFARPGRPVVILIVSVSGVARVDRILQVGLAGSRIVDEAGARDESGEVDRSSLREIRPDARIACLRRAVERGSFGGPSRGPEVRGLGRKIGPWETPHSWCRSCPRPPTRDFDPSFEADREDWADRSREVPFMSTLTVEPGRAILAESPLEWAKIFLR